MNGNGNEVKTIKVKDAPGNSTTYQVPDGRFIRVHLKLLTADTELATAQNIMVETSAYEVDEAGDFIVDDYGEPITMPRVRISIPTALVREGTDTMNAGWIKTDLAYNPKKPRDDQVDVKHVPTLPKTGHAGDRVYVESEKETYVYSPGLYENTRRQQLSNFLRANPVAVVTPLTDDQIESLKPSS
jgi:hypothetical protein